MPFITRNENAKINGVYANEQEEGQEFLADDSPELLAYLAPALPPLTPRQVRLVLNANNLRSAVEAAVAASDQNTKDMWEFSSIFLRSDPVLVAMAEQIGITSEQLDQMFIAGSNL